MRVLVLALMIALLPLRGWVGEAMAGQMAAQQLLAIKSGAASPVPMGAVAGFSSQAAMQAMPDCPGHMAGADQASTADVCACCNHCQVCSTAALQADPVLQPGPAAPQARPSMHAERFASAPGIQAIKPPIS
jgi:hypothetical protein